MYILYPSHLQPVMNLCNQYRPSLKLIGRGVKLTVQAKLEINRARRKLIGKAEIRIGRTPSDRGTLQSYMLLEASV